LPKRFDQARPFTTLAIVALGWLLVPAAVKTFTRASFFELTAPIIAAESHVRDLRDYWSLRLHSQNELIEAGRDLARVNASYALSVQRNTDLQAELDALETHLHLPPQPNFRYETARVIERDFSSWWQRLMIRKGRNFGITVGSPVVFTGGVVGRISEVHAATAVVDLISNPGVRLAAFFEGSNRPVSYQGGINPAFGPSRGVVEFVPLETVASETVPIRLVTSGLGGEFPRGLLIGQVTHLDASADGLFKNGIVKLDPRLSELTEVAVLVAEPNPAAPVR
jgi:rod shape-determining protein MreC